MDDIIHIERREIHMEPQVENTQIIQTPNTTQPNKNVTEDPGKTLGIIGLVLGLVGFALIGLILCIVGNNKSKEAGLKNTVAIIGIWINSIFIILGVLIFMLVFASIPALQQKNQEIQQRNEASRLQYEKEAQEASQN